MYCCVFSHIKIILTVNSFKWHASTYKIVLSMKRIKVDYTLGNGILVYYMRDTCIHTHVMYV